uniref:Uncharacterized protein n=1 Tax=Tetranychus urticae TaxID=32264 RepID=T1JR68_TETUR
MKNDYGKNHIVFNLYFGTWPDSSEYDIQSDRGGSSFRRYTIDGFF